MSPPGTVPATPSPPAWLPAGLANGRGVRSEQQSLEKDTTGLTDLSFDHDYRLLWLRAGVFQTQQHPAESPSISSGKDDCLNTLKPLNPCDSSVHACFVLSVVSLPSEREDVCWNSGELLTRFQKPFFFYEVKSKTLAQRRLWEPQHSCFIPLMCLPFLSERNGFSLGFIDCELLSLNHTPQQWKLFHSNYAESNCKTPMPFSLEVPHVSYKRFFSNWTVCRRGNLHAPVARSWLTTASGKSAQLFSSLSLSVSLENTEQSCGLTSNHILFFLEFTLFFPLSWGHKDEAEKVRFTPADESSKPSGTQSFKIISCQIFFETFDISFGTVCLYC